MPPYNPPPVPGRTAAGPLPSTGLRQSTAIRSEKAPGSGGSTAPARVEGYCRAAPRANSSAITAGLLLRPPRRPHSPPPSGRKKVGRPDRRLGRQPAATTEPAGIERDLTRGLRKRPGFTLRSYPSQTEALCAPTWCSSLEPPVLPPARSDRLGRAGPEPVERRRRRISA
jgi:hypothetical protein